MVYTCECGYNNTHDVCTKCGKLITNDPRIQSIDCEIAVLKSKRIAIESEPRNQIPPGTSIFKYTKQAQRKLDKIAWDITHLLAEKREINGDPVVCDGYSGRQTNRR